MTFRELREQLSCLSEEQLDQDVTVQHSSNNEYFVCKDPLRTVSMMMF